MVYRVLQWHVFKLKNMRKLCMVQIQKFSKFKVTHQHRVIHTGRAMAATDKYNIAVCQMTSVADKETNLQVVTQLVKDACKENVKMMFFPEACDFICDNIKDTLKSAEPLLKGPTVQAYRKLAKDNNVWLSMGGLHEKNEADPSKIFNTHVIIDSNGDIVQTYRKLHLFDVEIPERNVRLKESDFCKPGDHLVTPVDSPIGKIGLCICYDLRFPEQSTALSILNCQILTYPSAFTYTTGEAHWHILLRSRAIENQCYVIAAAQVGSHNSKRRSYGHALCVDPWGAVLVDCGDSSPCYRLAEISAAKVAQVRQNMPVFQHRRPQVYSLYTLSLRKDRLPEHGASLKTSSAAVPPETALPPDTKSYPFGHVKIPDSCVFYKSALTYAFVNLRCVTPGHVLVAPLRPAERNKDLTEQEAVDFYRTVVLVQSLMERVHKTESCTVTIQDGPDAGQTVRHLHCHIMPRKRGDFIQNDLIYLELAKHDQFTTSHPGKPPRSRTEMESEAKMLRQELEKMSVESNI